MEHTPRNNFKKITGLRLECYGSGDWHFTTAYTRWLEESYKEMLEILCECFRDDMVNDLDELLRIIEKRTGSKWGELNG